MLVVLTCTALYHALKEWEKNGGAPPKKPGKLEAAGGRKKEEWEYYFNRLNYGGGFYLRHLDSPRSIVLTLTLSRDLHPTYKHMEWAPEPVLGKGIGRRAGIPKWHDFT